MEQINDSTNEGNSISLSNEINSYLIETAKWGKFLAIAGYVIMGFLILLGLFMMIGLSMIPNSEEVGFPMGMVGVLYLVIAVIYYFPVNYLHRFSLKMKDGIKFNDANQITEGFENLKSLFKFMGIFTIVILSFYGLILLIAVPFLLDFSK